MLTLAIVASSVKGSLGVEPISAVIRQEYTKTSFSPDCLRWSVKEDVPVVLSVWHVDRGQVQILKHRKWHHHHGNRLQSCSHSLSSMMICDRTPNPLWLWSTDTSCITGSDIILVWRIPWRSLSAIFLLSWKCEGWIYGTGIEVS